MSSTYFKFSEIPVCLHSCISWSLLSQIIFLPLFSFFSFWDFHNEYMVSHRFLYTLLTFLHFSFCFSNSLISIVLSSYLLILSSSCLNPTSEFFKSVIVILSTRIYFLGSFPVFYLSYSYFSHKLFS